jgi:hypothetical protein
MRQAIAAVGIVGALVLSACGESSSTPTAVKTPVVSTRLTPAPSPTPSPSPSPTPRTSASLPPGLVCSPPTPPPMLRMSLKIHARDGTRIVLDSKPLVPNTNGYCEKAGFGDWKYCETRPEGHPERVACDYLAVGQSEATGRWGPTWYFGDDEVCGTNTENCANHPTEQFMAVAKKKGAYVACAAGDKPVADGGSRCGEIEVQ